MIALDHSVVTVRGEPLADIWWRGRQWAVTSYGIECLDGTYYIEKSRLTENMADYPWPRHLSEKEWCDSDEFATAFMVALVLHGYGRQDVRGLMRHFDKMARAEDRK